MAKNLILAGPKQVTLFDTQTVTIQDVGRNFYCSVHDVGKSTRSQACLAQLKELNHNVHVNIAGNDNI